jgi:1-deoxy-D-xylulose-5-phosphate synthase
MALLDDINSPADLKKLDRPQLEELSEEIRQLIIETTAVTGGHVAASLGVVELTLALHYVFDLPKDKIVWDVGHQCYAHKIITGRRDDFRTLRQYQGIGGFPRREESPYDAFNTGHSGTSISVGGGLLEGERRAGGDARLVAVIGDGSMTTGLSFEGLNFLGHLERDLIVVLNDNEMSISPNVGALSSYMNRLMTGQLSTRVREEVEKILKSLPGIGESVYKMARRAEESLKGFVIPGILFEELGFRYVGPIPGHQLDHLIRTFQNIRAIRKPILVHVITKKGKGYRPAEKDPTTFHGLGPFDPEKGLPLKKKAPPTFTSVFSSTLIDLAGADEKIVAITAAMPEGTGLIAFADRYPDRFYDVGIAEQHAVAYAAGMAASGLRPVVAIYSTFLQRAYDQIIHDVCLTKLPVIFALDRGGIVGDDGPTHQGLFDLTYLRSAPGMVVMAPKDEEELRHMLYTAFLLDCPVAVRYPRGEGVGVTLGDNYRELETGRAEVIIEGDDLAIMAVGASVHPALEAAEGLAEKGIGAMVVNARFVKPLDEEAVARAASTGRIITVEENVLHGGFGSAVTEALADMRLAKVLVKRLGMEDIYLEHGSQKVLRRKYNLDAEGIRGAAEEILSLKT